MENEIVKRQNFETAIRDIKILSSNTPAVLQLPRIEEDGGMFGWFEHNVTGKELNDYSLVVKQTFINQYNSVKKLYEVAERIWVALDALDEGHLKGIYTSIEIGNEAIKRIENTQGDLQKAFTILKGTVEKLKQFKGDISDDIIRLNKNLSQNQSQLEAISKRIEGFNSSSFINLLKSMTELESRVTYKQKVFDSQISRIHNQFSELKKLTDIKQVKSDLISEKKSRESLEKVTLEIQSSIEKIEETLSMIESLYELDRVQELISSFGSIEDTISDVAKKQEEQEVSLSSLKQRLSETTQTLAEHKGYAESLEARMASSEEKLGQRITDLDKSMADSLASNVADIVQKMDALKQSVENKIAEDKSDLEQSISVLQKSIGCKIQALSETEEAHKLETDRTLAAHKEHAESLEARMASSEENIEQRITDLDKSMADSIASNVAAMGQEMDALQKSIETKMAEDKATLEQSIVNWKEETVNKTKELELVDIKNKEDFQTIMESLMKEITEDKELTNKKFKWVYSIAGASLIINIILITLHACGVI